MKIAFLGGGSIPVTGYSESFQRADQPFMLGNNWWVDMDSTSNTGPLNLAAAVNCSIAGVTFGNTVLAAQNFFTKFIPAPVQFTDVQAGSVNRFEFAEMTLDSFAGATAMLAGPMVLAVPNSILCYYMVVNNTNGQVSINRNLSGAGVNISSPFVAAPGDVMRIEAKFDPAGNIVKGYQNGVLKATVVDTAGLGPTSGGIHGIAYFSGAIGTITFRNYSGGLV